MRKKINITLFLLTLCASIVVWQPIFNDNAYAVAIECSDTTQGTGSCADSSASSCAQQSKSFLGIPTWYEFLGDICSPTNITNTKCIENSNAAVNTCHAASGFDFANIWLIALAVLDILLRLGGFISFGIVMYGGFKYVTSQGQPDGTKAARQTILNAFIGIAIIIVASISVRFIASVLQK